MCTSGLLSGLRVRSNCCAERVLPDEQVLMVVTVQWPIEVAVWHWSKPGPIGLGYQIAMGLPSWVVIQVPQGRILMQHHLGYTEMTVSKK